MMNQAINAAIKTARAKVANDPRWLRSVEKAAAAMLAGEIIITVLANNSGVVTSANGSYSIRHGFCSCPAARNGMHHCYHISALRIATLADETAPAPVRRPTITRSIERNHNGPRLQVTRVDFWLV